MISDLPVILVGQSALNFEKQGKKKDVGAKLKAAEKRGHRGGNLFYNLKQLKP